MHVFVRVCVFQCVSEREFYTNVQVRSSSCSLVSQLSLSKMDLQIFSLSKNIVKTIRAFSRKWAGHAKDYEFGRIFFRAIYINISKIADMSKIRF